MEKDILVFKFIDGLLTNEHYMLLKKLANECGGKVFILPISPDDSEKIAEMVTAAALFVNNENIVKLNALDENPNSFEVMIKKLCIAAKYIISAYKMVVDCGEGEKSTDCTLSIVTSSAHIHIPNRINDKKTERFILNALRLSKQLYIEEKKDYLIYFDEIKDKIVCETKDEYVKHKYSDCLKADQN